MSPRTWTDQPAVCEGAEILWGCFYEARGTGAHTEIRGMPEPKDRNLEHREYLVTRGNLFGSETVRVHGEDALFALLRAMDAREPKLPAGCEIVPEDEPPHEEDFPGQHDLEASFGEAVSP